MKLKRIISLIVSAIISVFVLASCTITLKAPEPQSTDEPARVTATPESEREAGGGDDITEQPTGPTEQPSAPDTAPIPQESTEGGATAAPPTEIGGDTDLLFSKTAKLAKDKPARRLTLYGKKNSRGFYEEMLLWISGAESGEYLYSTTFEVIGNLEGAHIVTSDANFDGYTDVLVTLGAYGSHGHFQYFMLPGDGGDTLQAPIESFYNILNPVADAEDKVIRSLAADSPSEECFEIYRLADGEYYIDKQLILTYDEVNGKEIMTYTPYEYVNGVRQPLSVMSSSEPPDPHHPEQEQYYGEDSIWKLEDPIWYNSARYKGVPDDTMPEGGSFSGVVQQGRFYHEDRGEWIAYYYANVGEAQLETLKGYVYAYENFGQAAETEIQLYTVEENIDLRDYIGRRLNFIGEAFEAHSAYHRRNIIFEVREISPGEIEAPLDLRVTYKTEQSPVAYDRLIFTYTIPESVGKIPNVDFRIEMRENGGEWITADTEHPEPYLSPTMTQSITGELTCVFYRRGERRILALSQNRYEFRSCFSIGNMERSPYSNTVTLGWGMSDQRTSRFLMKSN